MSNVLKSFCYINANKLTFKDKLNKDNANNSVILNIIFVKVKIVFEKIKNAKIVYYNNSKYFVN